MGEEPLDGFDNWHPLVPFYSEAWVRLWYTVWARLQLERWILTSRMAHGFGLGLELELHCRLLLEILLVFFLILGLKMGYLAPFSYWPIYTKSTWNANSSTGQKVPWRSIVWFHKNLAKWASIVW